MIADSSRPKLYYVDQAKIDQYLLNADHPKGGPKAAFFLAFGFIAYDGWRLASALHAHALEAILTDCSATRHGVKFVFEGPIRSPDNRNPNVRSVWQVDRGDDVARFITAKPLLR